MQGKQARVKNADLRHSCNVKMQICVTRPKCVKSRAIFQRIWQSALRRSPSCAEDSVGPSDYLNNPQEAVIRNRASEGPYP